MNLTSARPHNGPQAKAEFHELVPHGHQDEAMENSEVFETSEFWLSLVLTSWGSYCAYSGRATKS
jgi:hypothetical protein